MNRRALRSRLWRDLRRALMIFLLASVVGLGINARLLGRVLSGQALDRSGGVARTPEMALPLPVELDEVREVQGGDALLIDARSREAFADGHLPGAFSLPRGELAEKLAALQAAASPNTLLIVYCSGYDCNDSFLVAQKLMDAGFRRVRVFEGGLPEWVAAGLPLAGGRP